MGGGEGISSVYSLSHTEDLLVRAQCIYPLPQGQVSLYECIVLLHSYYYVSTRQCVRMLRGKYMDWGIGVIRVVRDGVFRGPVQYTFLCRRPHAASAGLVSLHPTNYQSPSPVSPDSSVVMLIIKYVGKNLFVYGVCKQKSHSAAQSQTNVI